MSNSSIIRETNEAKLLVYLESKHHAELFCTFHGYSDYPNEEILAAIEKIAADARMIVTESAE